MIAAPARSYVTETAFEGQGPGNSIPVNMDSSDWSGRAMARSGLRMMPTFPLPSLKFRTAGFPQYGFKAGVSDKAFRVLAALTSIGSPLPFVLPAALV